MTAWIAVGVATVSAGVSVWATVRAHRAVRRSAESLREIQTMRRRP